MLLPAGSIEQGHAAPTQSRPTRAEIAAADAAAATAGSAGLPCAVQMEGPLQQEDRERGAELHPTSDEQALDERGHKPAAAIDAETAAAACSGAGTSSLPAVAGASLELPAGAAAIEATAVAKATLSLDAIHCAEAALDATADGLHLVERHQFLGLDGLPIAKGRRVRLCNLTKVTEAAPQVQTRMDPASQVSVKAAAVMQLQHGMRPEQQTACLLTFLTACPHAGAAGCPVAPGPKSLAW